MRNRFSGLYRRPRSPLLAFTLVFPSLLIILLLIIYPLLFSLVISFGKVGANFRSYQFVGLKNYLAVVSDNQAVDLSPLARKNIV